MDCHAGCAACCIAVSISTPIPGMGPKPAGVRCIHLSEDNRCGIFLSPERPQVCRDFMPTPDTCGQSFADALRLLSEWETLTD